MHTDKPESAKTTDLLTRLRNLHEHVKPPEGVRDNARPYMHFGDGLVYTCDSCGDIQVPASVWDLGVIQPDGNQDAAKHPYPGYLTLFSVIHRDSDEQTKEESKTAWRNDEGMSYALLEVLESLPQAIEAVQVAESMYALLDECGMAGIPNELAAQVANVRAQARRILTT
jgi:hypothetical protein